MKILIPTNDGLAIAPDFETTSSFRLLTVVNGMVQEDTIRPAANSEKELFTSEFHPTVIARGILPETERNLQKMDYEIVHTQEINIINAMMFYLKAQAQMESNYCCCP
jgi:hypothetical protein